MCSYLEIINEDILSYNDIGKNFILSSKYLDKFHNTDLYYDRFCKKGSVKLCNEDKRKPLTYTEYILLNQLCSVNLTDVMRTKTAYVFLTTYSYKQLFLLLNSLKKKKYIDYESITKANNSKFKFQKHLNRKYFVIKCYDHQYKCISKSYIYKEKIV